jgi:hypothetical protein
MFEPKAVKVWREFDEYERVVQGEDFFEELVFYSGFTSTFPFNIQPHHIP